MSFRCTKRIYCARKEKQQKKSFPNCYITAFLSQNNEFRLMVKPAVSNSVSYYSATCQNCPIAIILPKIKINTSGRISIVNFLLGFMTQL